MPAVLLVDSQKARPSSAKPWIPGKGKGDCNFQPLFQQQENPLGQCSIFRFINHFDPAAASQPQGCDALGIGTDLAEHAARFFRLCAKQFLLYPC